MANEPTIEQKNREIFDFMGFKHSEHKDIDEWEMKTLKYHEDWNQLMLVVDKIEALHNGNAFTVEIKGNWCLISQNTQHWMAYGDKINLENITCKGKTKLHAAYKAVYQFIQWLNQQKLNNDKR